MTLAKAKAKTNETFIVQASLTIFTYDCQNIFIVQATEHWGRRKKCFITLTQGSSGHVGNAAGKGGGGEIVKFLISTLMC
jgi:hypothetical protein